MRSSFNDCRERGHGVSHQKWRPSQDTILDMLFVEYRGRTGLECWIYVIHRDRGGGGERGAWALRYNPGSKGVQGDGTSPTTQTDFRVAFVADRHFTMAFQHTLDRSFRTIFRDSVFRVGLRVRPRIREGVERFLFTIVSRRTDHLPD
jgi:hypothetical protein